ncbi:ATP-binding protein [Myxococcus sp. 1LA]
MNNAGRSVGLGLYIFKSIVEAHGGHIDVVSTPEEGTRFTVHLPRHGRTQRERSASPSAPPAPEASQLRALLTEA